MRRSMLRHSLRLNGWFHSFRQATRPSRLGEISQVLERATPLFTEAVRESYVENLNTILAQSTSTAHLYFVLNRLTKLSKDNLMPAALIDRISTNIVNAWGNFDTPEAKELAAHLLASWQVQLPDAIRNGHTINMIAYAVDAPEAAWQAVKPYWTLINDTQRASIVKGLWGSPPRAICSMMSRPLIGTLAILSCYTLNRSSRVSCLAKRGGAQPAGRRIDGGPK